MLSEIYGGGSGIRTRDTVSRIHTFQACAFNRSATPPEGRFLPCAGAGCNDSAMVERAQKKRRPRGGPPPLLVGSPGDRAQAILDHFTSQTPWPRAVTVAALLVTSTTHWRMPAGAMIQMRQVRASEQAAPEMSM